MGMLGRLFHGLRVFTGLADAKESHITPDHGWLLAAPIDVRRERDVADAMRGGRSPLDPKGRL
jgi:hypothetical protein